MVLVEILEILEIFSNLSACVPPAPGHTITFILGKKPSQMVPAPCYSPSQELLQQDEQWQDVSGETSSI